MADINNQTGESGGTGAIAWIVLLIVVALIGWFLFRGIGTDNESDINVNIPATGTTSETGTGQ